MSWKCKIPGNEPTEFMLISWMLQLASVCRGQLYAPYKYFISGQYRQCCGRPLQISESNQRRDNLSAAWAAWVLSSRAIFTRVSRIAGARYSGTALSSAGLVPGTIIIQPLIRCHEPSAEAAPAPHLALLHPGVLVRSNTDWH